MTIWPGLFGFTNLLAIGAWLVLAFLPRKPLAHSVVLYLGVALLCLIYVVCFALFLTGSVDIGAVPGSAEPNFASIEGVRALFVRRRRGDRLDALSGVRPVHWPVDCARRRFQRLFADRPATVSGDDLPRRAGRIAQLADRPRTARPRDWEGLI